MLRKLATLLFKTRIGIKKIQPVLEFNQSQLLNPDPIVSENYGDEDGTTLYKLMNNVVHGKIMENLRNRIDKWVVSNKKNYLKRTSKPSYIFQKPKNI